MNLFKISVIENLIIKVEPENGEHKINKNLEEFIVISLKSKIYEIITRATIRKDN